MADFGVHVNNIMLAMIQQNINERNIRACMRTYTWTYLGACTLASLPLLSPPPPLPIPPLPCNALPCLHPPTQQRFDRLPSPSLLLPSYSHPTAVRPLAIPPALPFLHPGTQLRFDRLPSPSIPLLPPHSGSTACHPPPSPSCHPTAVRPLAIPVTPPSPPSPRTAVHSTLQRFDRLRTGKWLERA